MKVFIVLCVVIALVQSADWKPVSPAEFDKISESCYVSEKVPPDSVEALKTGKYPKQPGCYYRCHGIKTEIWDDKTGYNLHKTFEMLKTHGLATTEENLKKCLSDKEKNSDPCIWSANNVKCMKENKFLA